MNNINAGIIINSGGPLQSQLYTLIITAIIIIILCALYFYKQSKQDVTKLQRKGFVLFVDSFIKGTDKLVVDVMGSEFRWFSPYALFLFLYIGIGNLMSILSWDSPLTSYSVTLSLGLVTFLGIYICGFAYQRWRFILKFIKNPLEIIMQFAPLISITFRIFGNLTAGTTIIFLFFTLTTNLTGNLPFIGYVDLLGGVISPILMLYFVIFDGLVQTYIFTLLTLAYIGLEATHKIHNRDKSFKKKRLYNFFVKIKKRSNSVFDERIDLLRKK